MERRTEKHIEEDRLEAYSASLVAGEELEYIEEHLLLCITCQDRLDTVERYQVAMRSAAMRIREEQQAAPDVTGVVPWFRSLLRVPIPIWAGATAMVALGLVLVNLPTRRSTASPGPPVSVELQAVRGESQGTAPAGHALHLRLDSQGVPDVPVWHIEIVDSEGGKVWTGTGKGSDTFITADVPQAFLPGTYFVRLIKDPGVDPVREFQLLVQ